MMNRRACAREAELAMASSSRCAGQAEDHRGLSLVVCHPLEQLYSSLGQLATQGLSGGPPQPQLDS